MGDVKRYFGNLATGPDTSTTCDWVSAEDYEALRARLAEVEHELNEQDTVPRSRYNACNEDWLREKALRKYAAESAELEIKRLEEKLTLARVEYESQLAYIEALKNDCAELEYTEEKLALARRELAAPTPPQQPEGEQLVSRLRDPRNQFLFDPQVSEQAWKLLNDAANYIERAAAPVSTQRMVEADEILSMLAQLLGLITEGDCAKAIAFINDWAGDVGDVAYGAIVPASTQRLVPDPLPLPTETWKGNDEWFKKNDAQNYANGWNACRAKMLEALSQTPQEDSNG